MLLWAAMDNVSWGQRFIVFPAFPPSCGTPVVHPIGHLLSLVVVVCVGVYHRVRVKNAVPVRR